MRKCHGSVWYFLTWFRIPRCSDADTVTGNRSYRLLCWVQAHGGEPLIPFSGTFESKIFDMPEDEKVVYCKEVCPSNPT